MALVLCFALGGLSLSSLACGAWRHVYRYIFLEWASKSSLSRTYHGIDHSCSHYSWGTHGIFSCNMPV
jgi:hypothetical protein